VLIQQFFVDGLGCASYLLGSEEQGTAAVVDPERDVQPYLDAAQALGLRITHIIETHIHADHVSGNTDLAARTGAEFYIHEAAQAAFAQRPMKDGDILQMGEMRIQVKHTPGHTPESVTLLVTDAGRPGEPPAALTGDLLFVSDVGRPDLVSPEAARGQAGQLYESLFHTLLLWEDGTRVYPGHGAGSLCGRSIGSARSTTIGVEREHNPALLVRDREAFIASMTSNLPEQPGNHTRIKAMNRQGPKPLGEVIPKPVTVRQAITFFQKGAGLLDTRSKEAYIRLHIPGSVHIENDDQLSNRVGFVIPPEVPLVLMVENEQDYRRVVLSLARVGFENILGYLADGIGAWQALGLPVASGDIQDISPAELADLWASREIPQIVDVREPWEYHQGHIAGAVLIPLGQLGQRVQELDASQPVAVVCASGSRSQSAAALLGQKGFPRVYNLYNGMEGWARQGLPITRA